MGFFKKCRIRMRATRAKNSEMAKTEVYELLSTDYEETKAAFDKFDDDDKAAFRDVLGNIASDFESSESDGTMIGMSHLDNMEDHDFETLFSKI